MTQLSAPLKEMYMTQPYATDFIGGGFYCAFNPSCKHSGWDLRAEIGTPIYAGADGRIESRVDSAGGKYVNLYIPWGNGRELCVHHNHCSETAGDRKVQRGEQIGLTGNTGRSNGPHLHYGTRFFDNYQNGVRQVVNYDNGYRGYVDPTQFYPKSIWYNVGKEFLLPVDKHYGEEKPGMTTLEWYKANKWIWETYRRLMTTREKNALVYGYWDLQFILEPTNYHTWVRMTKPEYLKRIGKL